MYTDHNGETWFKGNLHTHTTRSDGDMTPDEAIALYRAHGYDFLALTDHWKVGETFHHENGLLVLRGCEYDFGRNVREGIYHILGVGMKEIPSLTRENTPQEAIDAIHGAGGVAALAHPCWSLNTMAHLMPLENVDFTEIYNTTSDLPRNCRPYSGEILDAMAVSGKYWALAATDDTHIRPDACRSFIYLQADALTEDAVMDAIRRGDFYGSQGPRMSVIREGDTVTVRCPGEDHVNCVIAVTDAPWMSGRTRMGDDLTEAVFSFTPNATWMRIEIRDSENRFAWSGYFVK